MFDYKKVVSSRETRLRILNMLSFIPDKPMLKLQYRIKTGRKLNLKNPKRFTEKIQWYKLYYRDPLMAVCSDKYAARAYVESCGLAHILNECYGVYDSVSDINFDALPNQFVAKDTLGGGGNSVMICKDKSSANMDEIKAVMQKWLDIGQQKADGGREWVYCRDRHRVIIEKYLEPDFFGAWLTDYKFYCFNGNTEYMYIATDRQTDSTYAMGFYNREFKRLDVVRNDERPLTRHMRKPDHYEEMRAIAETLALRFPHARIDLYSVKGKTIFGEITFFNASGYMTFSPDEFDYELGEKFCLPERRSW